MAFLVFHNNSGMTLSYDKAKTLEQVMNGEVQGTAKQLAFAKRVKKIYFGRQHENTPPVTVAPTSWWWK